MGGRLLILIAMYLPLAAVLALVGYAFTWKIPLAFALLMGFIVLRLRSNPSRAVAGRARTIIELFACALLGAVLGGVLFGGEGTLIGFAVGFSLGLVRSPLRFHARGRAMVTKYARRSKGRRRLYERPLA